MLQVFIMQSELHTREREAWAQLTRDLTPARPVPYAQRLRPRPS